MPRETIKSVEARIAQVKQELGELENQLATYQAETNECRLARELHDLSCRHNHTDGCGWFYEIGQDQVADWTEFAHREYLKMAQTLLRVCEDLNITPEAAIDIFKIIRGY